MNGGILVIATIALH